ncbi:MAG: hypothetical protein JNM00_00325 [Flavobacteriales bacterium]|nr:hypothetical protein [Flavobacteriales bacterium]
MKPHLGLVVLLLLISHLASAQGSPAGISYQAVARNGAGEELGSMSMNVIFTIHQGATDGVIVFEETHSTITNQFGLFTLIIGQGIPTGNGSEIALDDIDWASSSYFLRVQVDIPDDTTAWLLGVTQLLTVPYAFHSTTTEFYNETDGDPANELIDNVSLSGNTLTISESGNNLDVDLSGIAGDDADADPANETISSASLSGTDLTITEAGTDHVVSLNDLEDGWTASDTSTTTDVAVGIGTLIPQSTLQVQGSVAYAVNVVNYPGDFYLTSDHHVLICQVDAGPINVYLPLADSCAGRVYTIKRFASNPLNYNNDVWLLANVNDDIDGSNMYLMASVYEQFVTVISDGFGWWIINQYQDDN